MHYQQERNYGCRVSDAWTYRGLKTAILENELLKVVVLVDKGADVYQLVHKPTDTDFLWRSPWGVRDPRSFQSGTGSGPGAWLDHYEGGWQTVFPAGGWPSQYGDIDLGLHAEANLAPWDSAIIEDSPERVSMRFWIRTARTPFFFEKTLTLDAGSPVLQVDEELTNEGKEVAHCAWGEHIAIGEPFLNENCVIDIPGGTVINDDQEFHPNNRLKAGARTEWPWTEGVDGGQIDISRIPPRSVEAYDMSYFGDMPEGWYAVTDQKRKLGIGVAYPTEPFKFLWYWQSLGGGYGYPWYGRTYNVGLEPFTSFPNQGLEAAMENGTALVMQPGEKVSAWLRVVAFTGATGVESISPDGSLTTRS